MDSTTQIFAILIILLIFAVNAIVRRRRLPALRPIAAYEAMPELVDASIETNRPLHASLGSAAPGGDTTLYAMAGADIIYYVSQRASAGEAAPIVTVSDTAALPLATDTLRRAYRSRDRLDAYRPINVRWYPSGPRSLAFAAGLMALQFEEDVSSDLLVGSFGIEMALIADAAYRRQRPTIAVSDQLEGQAIAWALADYPLIGEEIFAAPAYLDPQPATVNRALSLDVLRFVLVLTLIVLAAVTLLTRLGA